MLRGVDWQVFNIIVTIHQSTRRNIPEDLKLWDWEPYLYVENILLEYLKNVER